MSYEDGQVYEMPVGRNGKTELWIVTSVEPSPRPDYDGLIVFATAAPQAEQPAPD